MTIFLLASIISVAASAAFMWYVFPALPREVILGFWAAICVYQIVQGHALFAAVYAAVTVSEWYSPLRRPGRP